MHFPVRGLAAFSSFAILAGPASAWAQHAGETDIIRLPPANGDETPAALIARLERQMEESRMALARQSAELERLKAALSANTLAVTRAGGPGAVGLDAADTPQVTPPRSPVGTAPPTEQKVEVASLPEGAGVLTPRGHFVLEPSIDYTHGSTNRLVFRGVEIVTGVQIGVIEASDADRNATSASLTGRFGVTDRLEIEARIPYLYRADRITTLVQREETATRTMELTGSDIGDVELAARYQLNRGLNGRPILIANLRVKSNTGSSPFEISRDEFGVSEELATGSGFWAIEPSFSFLYPTDPAVVFGSIGYLANIGKDINQNIGGVLVGEVDPGDSLNVSAGFGFALNPRFSFSMGYKHSYIFPTKSEIGPTIQKSESLQVGGFTFGWSFRLTERMTISNTYEIGTTRDAPDMRVAFRLPIRF